MLSCFLTCLSAQVEAAHCTKTCQLLSFLPHECSKMITKNPVINKYPPFFLAAVHIRFYQQLFLSSLNTLHGGNRTKMLLCVRVFLRCHNKSNPKSRCGTVQHVIACWLRAPGCSDGWAGFVWLVLIRYNGNAGKLEVIPTHSGVWKHFPEGNHNTTWQIFIHLSQFRKRCLLCFTVLFNVSK